MPKIKANSEVPIKSKDYDLNPIAKRQKIETSEIPIEDFFAIFNKNQAASFGHKMEQLIGRMVQVSPEELEIGQHTGWQLYVYDAQMRYFLVTIGASNRYTSRVMAKEEMDQRHPQDSKLDPKHYYLIVDGVDVENSDHDMADVYLRLSGDGQVGEIMHVHRSHYTGTEMIKQFVEPIFTYFQTPNVYLLDASQINYTTQHGQPPKKFNSVQFSRIEIRWWKMLTGATADTFYTQFGFLPIACKNLKGHFEAGHKSATYTQVEGKYYLPAIDHLRNTPLRVLISENSQNAFRKELKAILRAYGFEKNLEATLHELCRKIDEKAKQIAPNQPNPHFDNFNILTQYLMTPSDGKSIESVTYNLAIMAFRSALIFHKSYTKISSNVLFADLVAPVINNPKSGTLVAKFNQLV